MPVYAISPVFCYEFNKYLKPDTCLSWLLYNSRLTLLYFHSTGLSLISPSLFSSFSLLLQVCSALSFLFFSRLLQNCNIFMGQDFLLSVNVFLHIYHFASSFFTLSGFPSLLYYCSSFLDLLLCQRLAGSTTCLLYDSYVIQVRNNPCQWGRC